MLYTLAERSTKKDTTGKGVRFRELDNRRERERQRHTVMSAEETKSPAESCRLLTWNVNGAQNTFANIRLRHGSLRDFADSLSLDLICLQVGGLDFDFEGHRSEKSRRR